MLAIKGHWMEIVRALSEHPPQKFTEEDKQIVELCFMACFGCRPDEACKLFDAARSKFEPVRSRQLEKMWQ